VRRVSAVALCALVLVPAAGAKPLFGVLGSISRFESLTGQHLQVGHLVVGWGQGATWGVRFPRLFTTMGDVPLLGFGASARGREVITPAQIADGKGDAFLAALNAAIAAHDAPMYIRPLGEMNGHWNSYCAFTKDGRPKPGHSTRDFKKAFARIYLIVHGGPAVVINAQLHRLGLPPVAGDLPANPAPLTKVIWNPQGYGAPDIPANRAKAYYPGDKYVDVVGNDLYDQHGKAEWDANEALYKAHPSKPYAIPEWGLWGIDDPLFVLRMAAFIKTHRRLEIVSYFNSKPGSVFDLASKPGSLAAYRRAITPLG
jgi:Glycosyl hydrolase family 26